MTHKLLLLALLINSNLNYAAENHSNISIKTGSKTNLKSELLNDSTFKNTTFSVSTPQEFLSAISAVNSGDIIYVQEGTYTFNGKIGVSKSGNSENPISILPHPDNTTRPTFDFSSMSENSSNRAISLSGSYWHIKGIDVFGAGDNGMFISGHHNTIEFCSFSECKDSGLQIGNGASNNTILNCDSYNNADSSIENADGFACKLDAGDGNAFIGCRAWQNLDDGWDGYLRGADNITTTYENCWAFNNGYLKNGTIGGGDGNGFKTGGSDDKLLKHNAIYKNCIAINNVYDGFDHNSNRGNVELYNCASYLNGRNINFSSNNIAQALTIKNTISFEGKNSDSFSATTTDISNNSWQDNLQANNEDFTSLDIEQLKGARKTDGSLPDITFMQLVTDSDLIDKGVDIGLPFNGTAPDLGAFESAALSIKDLNMEQGLNNYPNPFTTQTNILFNTIKPTKLQVSVYNLLGVKLFDLVENKMFTKGQHTIVLDRNNMSSGNYIVVLKGENSLKSSKIITVQ